MTKSRRNRGKRSLGSFVTSEVRPVGRVLSRIVGATVAHPVVTGTAAAVAGGLIVFALTGTGSSGQPGAADEAAKATRPSCEPAIRFQGYNDSLPAGAKVVRQPPGRFSGQIERGDILRVSKRRHGEFVDAVTVTPGSRVTVGLRLSNPGPGDVGEVKARVDLPDRAASALQLKVLTSWDGVTGPARATDTATIFVSPSNSRACARYIPQSTWGRLGEAPRTPMSIDWITSESGAYFGEVGERLRDIQFVYFDVVVI